MDELELIERVRALIREAGVGAGPGLALGAGDDAAVVSASGASAVSVDAIVEGVHFRLETAPPRSVGRKALAAALSDLAAVGARPAQAYVVLGLRPGLGDEACEELVRGLVEGARDWRVTLAGGDVTAAPSLFLSVTVAGELESASAAVPRSGARPGQAAAVTGTLGGAAAGLLLLDRPELAEEIGAQRAAALRARQLEPAPRLAAGIALAGAGATAMIDLSDGIGADASHLAAASSATLEVDVERLPLAPGVAELARAAGVEALELAGAGEDYELLCCLDPGAVAGARAAVEAAGTTLTEIGAVSEGAGEAVLRDASGRARTASGYVHPRRGGAGRPGSA